MSEATADERLTAGMRVFLECLKKSGSKVEKLDKNLIDHRIAELDCQISRQLDAVMHHEAFQAVECLCAWREMQGTWLQVISLRCGPIFQAGEGRWLWERCIADVERVQDELKVRELDEASCQHILAAQCTRLDEAVKGRGVEDDACVQWYDIPIQGHFLEIMDAGDTLCERMRDALSKLTQLARPDVKWHYFEKCCLSLYEKMTWSCRQQLDIRWPACNGLA